MLKVAALTFSIMGRVRSSDGDRMNLPAASPEMMRSFLCVLYGDPRCLLLTRCSSASLRTNDCSRSSFFRAPLGSELARLSAARLV